MASIGGITVTITSGAPVSLGRVHVDITRDGENGYAFKEIGKRGPVYELKTFTAHADAAAAGVQVKAFKDLADALVTVIDSHGVSHTNQAIQGVFETAVREVRGQTTSTDNYWLFCTWRMRAAL